MRLTSILNRVTTKRLAKCWILGWAAALGLVAIPSEAAGQITITTKDMFTKEGQYYKMYSNFVGHFSEAPQEEVDVFDYIGEAGEDQVWDFREGPEDELIQFDYVKPSAIDTDVVFEGATLVERATYDSTGKQKSLFVDLKPGVGRYVYGFHDESIDEKNPAIPFSGRLLDFPAVIQYNDEWRASTSYEYVTRSELLTSRR